jgi:prophage regulatory protein
MNIKPAYVDLPGACQFVALSESTLQKMVREDQFPRPRALSAKRVGWLVRELEEWAESRPVSELPPPANTGARKGRLTA